MNGKSFSINHSRRRFNCEGGAGILIHKNNLFLIKNISSSVIVSPFLCFSGTSRTPLSWLHSLPNPKSYCFMSFIAFFWWNRLKLCLEELRARMLKRVTISIAEVGNMRRHSSFILRSNNGFLSDEYDNELMRLANEHEQPQIFTPSVNRPLSWPDHD